MKKYNMSKIMNRAWELVKKMGMTISAGLKKAWKEAKAMVEKKKIEQRVKILKPGYPDCADSNFLFFNRYQKNGKNRIYVNDYKRRTIGFFEDGVFTKYDNQGNTNADLEATLAVFQESYEF